MTRRVGDAYDPGTGRRRRSIIGAAVVAGTLLALVALKCALTLVATSVGERAWQNGDPTSALRWYSVAGHANVAERWISPYNSGVAAFDLQQWQRSAEYFAQARETVPPDALCRVVINQVVALEAHGDALEQAEDIPGAQVKYREAQGVLADATGCAADSSDAGAQDSTEEGDSAQSSSTPEEAQSDADASDPADAAGQGESQGEGESEGSGEGSSSGSKPGEGQTTGTGRGGQGPLSEQAQVDAAKARLADKSGSGTAEERPSAPQETQPEQAEELAERNAEGVRQAQTGRDGAGSGESRQAGRTW